MLVLAEIFHTVELGRIQEPAVERVTPAVITAAERLAGPLARRDGPGPVTADVGESPDAGVRPPGDEERLAGDLGGEERAGGRDLVLAPDELPRPREDPISRSASRNAPSV